MFSIGDRVIVTDLYSDKVIRGIHGTVTKVDIESPYPYKVNLDLTKRTENGIFRRILFLEEELTAE